jgi:hypothetical protein
LIEITASQDEINAREFNDQLERHRRQFNQFGDKASAAVEQNNRPMVFTGQSFYLAQVTAAINPMTYTSGSGCEIAVMATGGAVKLCKLVGNSLYRRYPNITVSNVVNATGGTIPLHTVVVIFMGIDGQWIVMLADCYSVVTGALCDEPH